MRDQVNIVIEACRVRLHPSQEALLETGWFRVPVEKQFISPIQVFDATPNVIARSEAQCGFDQIAVEYFSRGQRAVPSPNQSRSGVAVAPGTIVGDGRRHSQSVFAGIEFFGAFQACDGVLTAPVLCRIDSQPCGPRIDFAGVDIPTIFVRLTAVKPGDLHAHGAVSETERHYVIRKMSGILQMVTERCNRVLTGRDAMRVGGGTHGWIADRSDIKRKQASLTQP